MVLGETMNILILGADGYIGRPLANYLKKRNHRIFGIDNFSRRTLAKYNLTANKKSKCIQADVAKVKINLSKINAVVHLAQQPSAPYSMKNFECAKYTQNKNITSTLNLLWSMAQTNPDVHLVKLGTMGEYGTPSVNIPEGFIENTCERDLKTTCPYAGMMFPRSPGSFYHLSKVFDTMNIEFACKTWGLMATDIMQGIVFGLNYWDPEKEITRFDYDEIFGTVINRFCLQAIANYPLTVYGRGKQTRGFLPLSDSIECITRAIENPPAAGKYRVFNQYAKIYNLNQLASSVKKVAQSLFPSKKVTINHVLNPRVEMEKHQYNTKNDNLKKLGYNPRWTLEKELEKLLSTIVNYRQNIDTSEIYPRTTWKYS